MTDSKEQSVRIVGGSLSKLATALGYSDTEAFVRRLERSGFAATEGRTVVKVDRTIATKEEIDGLIEVGAHIDQLCRIFSMDSRDVKAKLTGKVAPSGQRRGHDVYAIKEVAPYLAKLPMNIDWDDYFKRITSADLPAIVNKDFWAGKRGHLAFLREKKEVVPLDMVIAAFSAVFKSFRTSTLLIRDSLERQTELTDAHRKVINHQLDNLLVTTYDTTISNFPQIADAGNNPAGLRPAGADDMEL